MLARQIEFLAGRLRPCPIPFGGMKIGDEKKRPRFDYRKHRPVVIGPAPIELLRKVGGNAREEPGHECCFYFLAEIGEFCDAAAFYHVVDEIEPASRTGE